MEAKLYNGLTLAYIGDAIYELRIRDYVLNKGLTKVNELNKEATKYTKGEAQALAIRQIINRNILTSKEFDMFRRGRNANVKKVRKNITRANYLEGTGFESLIGYLYLEKNIDRMDYIISLAIQIIESEANYEKTK